jgi:hypothetical protein
MHQLAEEELESSVNSKEKTSIQFAREDKTMDVASAPSRLEATGDAVQVEDRV